MALYNKLFGALLKNLMFHHPDVTPRGDLASGKIPENSWPIFCLGWETPQMFFASEIKIFTGMETSSDTDVTRVKIHPDSQCDPRVISCATTTRSKLIIVQW